MLDPKPGPNHLRYLEALGRMTPEERVLKAIELSDLSRRIFKDGLRHRFPDFSEPALHKLFIERLAHCHNRNY